MNNKIKTNITFVFLKLLELGSVFGLTFGIYFLGKALDDKTFFSAILLGDSHWFNGLTILTFGFIVILISILILYLIYCWFVSLIKINWRWATILNETPKEKKNREKLEAKKGKGELEAKKKEHIKEHGFWIGDKIKVIKSDNDDENQLINKIFKVENITWLGVKIKNYHNYLSHDQVKPIKNLKKKL